MPMASYAPSPWELGPFRSQTTGAAPAALTSPILGPTAPPGAPGSGAAPGPPSSNSGPQSTRSSISSGLGTPTAPGSAPASSHPSLGDLTTSPKSRGSFSSAKSSTLVGSRGSLSIGSSSLVGGSRSSLSSFASSMGSLASQAPPLTSQGMSQASMLDDPKPMYGTNAAAAAALVVSNLPREMSVRECQLLFALAPDLVSSDVSRNAVSGELTIYAKFLAPHAAQAVAYTLERLPELIGSKVKVTLQSLPMASAMGQQQQQPLLSQQTQPQRSIYPSRPLFAESYWSNQPMTPMSPLGQTTASDLFSNSRSASIVSPTDPLFPGAQSHPMSSHQETPDSPFRQPTSHNGSASSIGSTSSRPGSVGNIGSAATSAAATAAAAVGQGLGGAPPAHHSSVSSTGSGSGSSSGAASASASRVALSGAPTAQSVRRMPPQNPADQNPPCNTLYVGNLPPDTSEAELKELFSAQPGYRRLCFRAKQNGPMCFVEFEDEALAGRALDELYGMSLSNSVKGGIRLSYSKNPLGVRSRTTRPK